MRSMQGARCTEPGHVQGLQENRKFEGLKSRDEVTLIFKVYNPVRSQRRAWQSKKVSFGEVL